MRSNGVVERVEELGLRVRLYHGRLQFAETVPGAKERHRQTVVTLSAEITQELAKREGCQPRIDKFGNLVVPFDAPCRYRWWEDGGQRISQTLAELHVSRDIWERYTDELYPFPKRDVIDGGEREDRRPNEN